MKASKAAAEGGDAPVVAVVKEEVTARVTAAEAEVEAAKAALTKAEAKAVPHSSRPLDPLSPSIFNPHPAPFAFVTPLFSILEQEAQG
jgi:hypothetical protein